MYKNNSKCSDDQCYGCCDGRDGRKGRDGLQGPLGPPGPSGSTILTGAGLPPIGSGANNDLFIDTTTNNFYQKINGTWLLKGNLTGVQGPPGAQAIRAAISSTGVVGLQNPSGSINVVHVGTGQYVINFTTPASTGYTILAQLTEQITGNNVNVIVRRVSTSSSFVSLVDFSVTGTGGMFPPAFFDLNFTIIAFPV